MTDRSNGEVFGAKVLNLAIIGGSAFILLGVLWQPAPLSTPVAGPSVHIEQVVAKAPVAHHVTG